MKVSEMYVEIGAKIDKLESALNRMEGDIKNTGKRSEAAAKESFGNIGSIIAGAFSVQAIVGFSKQIIAARGEFERFSAVLTNTLGSESAAQSALADITKFAAQTPFAVNELTGAFVKLANQGFRPTLSQMQKLGDIASSTGKDFDQLAEAIIDAQVGEFERLKEFGIRAQKEGDRVKFTFKGVATEVAFTEQAMRSYILSLGDVQGVSGSMAAISETLEGKISNLGDSWNSLLITLGNTKVIKGSVSALSEFISSFNQAIVDFEISPLALSEENFKALEVAMERTLTPEEKAKALQGFTKEQVRLIKAVKDGTLYLEREKTRIAEGQAAMDEYAKSLEKTNNIERPKPTSKELDAWHALGEAAYLTSQILEDAFGASAIDISGPIIEMDRLTDLEMEEALSRMSVELEDVTEKLKNYYGELERANMAGELFGSVLNNAFEAALINGESFFETFGNGLKQLIQQLAAAAATSLVLSAILSTFMPGVGFGKIFGQVAGGMGGSGGTLSGIFKLFGTDLVASGDRTTGQQGRF
jgi:hypothetical protein